MKSRLLYVIFSFLALFSSYAGFGVQRAVFSSSDELKIVSSHAASPDFISVAANETKISGINESSFSRSQKKAEFSFQFAGGFAIASSGSFSSNIPFLSGISESTSRVLLLPKSVENIIFLQTVI